MQIDPTSFLALKQQQALRRSGVMEDSETMVPCAPTPQANGHSRGACAPTAHKPAVEDSALAGEAYPPNATRPKESPYQFPPPAQGTPIFLL